MRSLAVTLFCTVLTVSAQAVPRTLILVTGAGGTEEYAAGFASQAEAWRMAGGKAGAAVADIGRSPEDAAQPDREQLREALAAAAKPDASGAGEVWLILLGHGTWDGKEARFNLRGPDVSSAELAEWLRPLSGPVAVVHTGSSSGPFLPALSAPGRVIITATRAGSEQNYARFGQYFTGTIGDPAADLDQDGAVSLLEMFLVASARVAEFYQSEGRLMTEHALLDDNGDGLGTPADWFRGVRAVKKAGDKAGVDGMRARTLTFLPDNTAAALSPEALAKRDALEAQIATLRDGKDAMREEDYYRRLEALLVELARVYPE